MIEDRRRCWPHLFAGYGVIGILITPLLPHMCLLLREAHTLPFTSPPQTLELIESLLPTTITFGLFAVAILTQFAFPNGFRKPRSLRAPFQFYYFPGGFWQLPSFCRIASSDTSLPPFPASTLLAYAGYSLFQTLTARCWALCAMLLSTASPLAFLAVKKTGREELQPLMNIIQSHSRTNAPPVFLTAA